MSCPSERVFLVGLASAKTAAAELRMVDGDARGSAKYDEMETAAAEDNFLVDFRKEEVRGSGKRIGDEDEDEDDQDDQDDPYGDMWEEEGYHSEDDQVIAEDEMDNDDDDDDEMEDEAETSMLSPVKLKPKSTPLRSAAKKKQQQQQQMNNNKERRGSITGEVADEVMGGILGAANNGKETRAMGLLLAGAANGDGGSDNDVLEPLNEKENYQCLGNNNDDTVTITFGGDDSTNDDNIGSSSNVESTCTSNNSDSSRRTVLSFMRSNALASLPLPLLV